ncbi:hypothetical protein SNEBB_005687 [Seison nebaliae]|nr:hypothetical protein SNEBB_005687 [Seison nebaliae]
MEKIFNLPPPPKAAQRKDPVTAVIVDVSYKNWEGELSILIESLCSFIRISQIINAKKRIIVIGCDSFISHFIFDTNKYKDAPPLIRQIRIDIIDGIEELRKLSFDRLMRRIDEDQLKTQYVLSEAVSRAVCIMTKKLYRENVKNELILIQFDSVYNPSINSIKNVSLIPTHQQMSSITSVFLLEKQNILFTVIHIISNERVTNNRYIIQQAISATNGIYVEIERRTQLPKLLNYLLKSVGNTVERNMMKMNIVRSEHTTCCCHQQLIDQGYLCTTCLTLYCRLVPFCIFCRLELAKERKGMRHVRLNGWA